MSEPKLLSNDFISERFFIIYLADRMIGDTMDLAIEVQQYPDRPNGGKWLAFGEKSLLKRIGNILFQGAGRYI